MVLQNKYQELINTAKQQGVTNLKVREQDNMLYIDGDVPSTEIRNKLWDIYNKIDPDYRAGDLVMNLNTPEGATEEYEVVKGDTLSAIGKKFGVPWKEIYEANRDQIKNPDLIQIGWKLKIPQKASVK